MSERLHDYFASEAGEFLDRLDSLLAGANHPEPAELLRTCRGVRGSARIAGAREVERAAGAMESALREIVEDPARWSTAVRERVARTVSDLRALVRAHPEADSVEGARSADVVARWNEPEPVARREAPAATEPIPLSRLFPDDDRPVVLSSGRAPVPTDDPHGTSPGVTQFLETEGAGLLEQARVVAGSPVAAVRVPELLRAVAELARTFRNEALAKEADEVVRRLGAGLAGEGLVARLDALASILRENGSEVGAPLPDADHEVVPVEDLLLRGEAALREALLLREPLRELAADPARGAGALQRRLDELFDLVELATEASAPSS